MKIRAIEEIPLENIIEDPDQPRKVFDISSLKELAETIKSRKVKSPISVRTYGNKYIINHGARRYRASIMAGLKTIPAYLDEDYQRNDQVIENLQRENLTPDEISVYIESQLNEGKSKAQIAREIGKSKAYVSQYAALLNLPEPLAKIYQSGRCKNVTLINDFASLYQKYPQDLNFWLSDENNLLTKHNLSLLRQFLNQKELQEQENEITDDALFYGCSNNNESYGANESKSIISSQEVSIEKRQKDIDTFYMKGKNCIDIEKDLIKGLLNEEFATNGQRLLCLIAFLHGVKKKKKLSLSDYLKIASEYD